MPSSRVHSRYWRVIQDTTILSLQVFLHVRARKFFCDHSACSQHIFTERPSDWWSPYARRTNRLTTFLKHLAFSLSAETASKVSKQYGIPTSADSFLYLIRKEEIPSITEPIIIGIDDWVMKKGQRYGSIICDLQTQKPIALLENRTVQEVSNWLRKHPSIQVVTRDGSTEYAKGIREGCPHAVQITDRWHLFHNLTKKVEQFLKKSFPRHISICVAKLDGHRPSGQEYHPLTASEKRKWELIQQVQLRYKEGRRKADIIREFCMDRKTLDKYLQLKKPLKHTRRGRHSVDPYRSQILELLQAQATVHHIFSVIQKQGYDKSLYIARLRKKEMNEKNTNKIRISRYKLQAYLWSQLLPTQEEQIVFDKLFKQHEALHRLKSVIQAFQKLMNEQKNEQALQEWLLQAENSKIHEIQPFIKYIRSDIESVKHALSYSWSNGFVEGQVDRLKVIKRQMYGRAKLDLLSKKVLYQFV
jgi:transposase